jgi:DNA-binding XRE family transcriptional regulator
MPVLPDLMRARDPDEIRAAMKARGGLTHRELAKLADSPRSTLGFILNGRSTNRDVAIRIARVLRRPLDALFVAAASRDKQSVDKQPAA